MSHVLRFAVPAVGMFVAVGLAPADDKAAPVKVLGELSAAPPAEWKAEKPINRLRSHQFKMPGAADHADGELIVMPESSKDADKYFPRWKGSFVPPEGKTVDDVSKETKWEAGGATVRVLDVSGTWRFKERPFDPKSKEELKDDYRVVWAVVAKGDDASHVRLSGPAPTVAKHYPAFEAWLKALK